jgi:hypothetical protein
MRQIIIIALVLILATFATTYNVEYLINRESSTLLVLLAIALEIIIFYLSYLIIKKQTK